MEQEQVLSLSLPHLYGTLGEREKGADLVGRSLYMASSRGQMAGKALQSKAGGSNMELTHTFILNTKLLFGT